MKKIKFIFFLIVFLVIGYFLGNFIPLRLIKSSEESIEPSEESIQGQTILEVKVMTEDKNLLAGIEVDIARKPGPPPIGGVASTDENGLAVFNIKPGKYFIFFNTNNFPKNLKCPNPQPIKVKEGIINTQIVVLSETEKGEKRKESLQEILLVKDDFSLSLPKGWKETSAPAGVSAMATNIEEEIADSKAKRINFRTYVSVNYDSLNSRSKEEYLNFVKNSLIQTLPGITFTYEKTGSIDSRDAYFIEAEVRQQQIDFKILLVLIKGNDEDVWRLNFNTLKSNWIDYKELFYQTAETFKVKIR